MLLPFVGFSCAQVQIIRSKSDPNYKPPYTTVSACVRATLRENGFKGPFQGLGATILRNTPANAVYLGTFEVLKGQAAQRLGCKVSVSSGGRTCKAGGGAVQPAGQHSVQAQIHKYVSGCK